MGKNLDEKLSDEARSSGAQGTAHGKFLAAGEHAGEEDVRDIEAGDEQDEEGDGNGDDPTTMALWNDLFMKILSPSTDPKKLTKCQFTLLLSWYRDSLFRGFLTPAHAMVSHSLMPSIPTVVNCC